MRVVEELNRHKSNKENDNLAKLAKESLKLLKKLMEKDLVELRGEKNDDFADSVFFTVFTKHRMKHKLLLITQDSDLAKDIYSLNENKSVIGNKINVKQINKYGFLSNFKWSAQNTKTINHAEDLDKDEVFNISKNITTCDDSIIAVTHIPTINENVYMSSGSIIKLNSKIGDGGEGA